MTKTNGLQMIAAERARQITEEGYTPEHDDQYASGALAMAAATYATPEEHRDYSQGAHLLPIPNTWPWPSYRWQPAARDRIRELVKAGALILAEIERLQRACDDETA